MTTLLRECDADRFSGFFDNFVPNMDTAYTEAGYEALLQDIFQRFPSVQKEGFTAGAYKPGLERMLSFDQALGCPSKAFKAVHIAGTNGKGSVSSLLASALSACGLQVGLFTSPHLLDFRERMRMGGSMVPKEYVFTFLTRWMPWIQEHQLSFFEITTGLAFQWFADAGAQVAVIETGLGGRLDSTNILQPVLSVVTTIGLDHCALLGDTLPQIAAEKAGIFKAGVPAVVGEYDPETAPVFDEKASGFCPLTYADQVLPSLWDRRKALLEQMDLQADVQEKNLRTVFACLDILRQNPDFQVLADETAVIPGIVHAARNTAFHGRWERLSENPYVLCDIGHNAHALRHNFAQLERMMASGRFGALYIIYGIMADKDLDAILPLMPMDATYCFVAPDTPRALPAPDILRRFEAYRSGAGRAFTASSVRGGVQQVLELAGEASEKPLIYIGGSTFVVAEALPLFSVTL